MSAHFFGFSRLRICLLCFALAQGAAFGQQPAAYSQNIARFRLGARVEAFHSNPNSSLELGSKSEDNVAQAALISDHPTVGYALPDGRTDLVLSLSKIENIDSVTFLNTGAIGIVAIATSNSRLAAGSPQWHQIAEQALTPNVTKVKLGPTEAKYVRFTFKVSKPGRIADLGVYSMPSLTIANTNLAAGGEVASDGKDFKDYGGKEAKEVAEAPAEGPPPTLPDPPPFVFVPQISE